MKYNDLEVVIIKKRNKHTYIRVKEDMKIYITTGIFTSKREIEKLIEENVNKIDIMIEDRKKKNKYEDEFYFLGKKYEIKDNPLKEDINKWYKKQAEKIFKERLDKAYNEFEEEIPYPHLTIRKMKTRWGVCNRKLKRVTLNLELIKKDYKYIDYVIVHELSHFIHFNHSSSFWFLVGKYIKNYKVVRRELKK